MLTPDRTPDSDDNANGKEILKFKYVRGLQEHHPDALPVAIDCTIPRAYRLLWRRGHM